MTNSCISTLYESLLGIPQQVFQLFVDFYGEERVDLQCVITYTEFKFLLKEQLERDSIDISLDDLTLETCIEHAYIKQTDAGGYEWIEYKLNTLVRDKIRTYIHYPTLTITNEYDRSHTCRNVYVYVEFNYAGKGGYFRMNKSTYTEDEYRARYLHSHVPSIDYDHLDVFAIPCLGYGPIGRTISLLHIDYDEELWQLYILELDNYMSTESLRGGPYIKMEYIRPAYTEKRILRDTYVPLLTRTQTSLPRVHANMLIEFQTYLIEKKLLKFNFINNTYGINMSMQDFTIFISNEFIDWYNQRKKNGDEILGINNLFYAGILSKAILEHGSIFFLSSMSAQFHAFDSGRYLFNFKDEEIYLEIVPAEVATKEDALVLLTPQFTQWILRNILILANQTHVSTKLNTGPRNAEVSQRVRIL